MLAGALATVVAAGLLMWRHQAGLRAGVDAGGGGYTGAEAHRIEAEAVQETEAESRVG